MHDDNRSDDQRIRGKDFLIGDRPFSWACCCLCRPTMTVSNMEIEGGSKEIGKIIELCTCCTRKMEIRDPNDELMYHIESDCAQLGWWCRCPCNACEVIKFEIKDKLRNNVGSLIKKPKKCFDRFLTSDDKFHVKFGNNMQPVDKSLVMASVVMTDMC